MPFKGTGSGGGLERCIPKSYRQARIRRPAGSQAGFRLFVQCATSTPSSCTLRTTLVCPRAPHSGTGSFRKPFCSRLVQSCIALYTPMIYSPYHLLLCFLQSCDNYFNLRVWFFHQTRILKGKKYCNMLIIIKPLELKILHKDSEMLQLLNLSIAYGICHF